jgi:hypothetical protein
MVMRSWIAATLLALGSANVQGTSAPAGSQPVSSGRITIHAMPADLPLARNLIAFASANDTFPGLPRPRRPVTVLIAPDEGRLREWIGGGAPEWGVAFAILEENRIVMQGRSADSRAGNPQVTLRHELTHLALHELAGDGLPLWFHEGYASFAAGEWARDQLLATNFILALRGVPHLATLDSMISGGSSRAEQGYALAHRAVSELAAKDPRGGLSLFFRYWSETHRMDAAIRRGYGITYARFEEDWRRTTRRRYGALALFADVGFASLVLFVIIAPFWWSRRKRDRARLAALAAADALAEQRERESAIAELLGEGVQHGVQEGDERPGENAGNDGKIKET